MSFPTIAVEIAKHSMGPLVPPSENGYVTADGVTDVATYAFGTSDLLDLTNNYVLTFDVHVPFIDPADFASSTDPTVVLARIEEASTRVLEFGLVFNVGEASGTTAVMYAFLDGTGTVYSDPVPELSGIDATPARLIVKFNVNSGGEVTFDLRDLGADPNEFGDVTAGTFSNYGNALTFGSRSSAAGTFIIGDASTTTPARIRRCRLPGTAETDFDDHDGTDTYTDASRTWTVNNSQWRERDWVDVTDLVRFDDKITTSYGRTTDLGVYAPGTCGFVLDNTSRAWDPYGSTDVRPWLQVRVLATFTTQRSVFTGYVRAFTPEFDLAGVRPLTRANCVDGFGLLANYRIGGTATAAALALSPIGYWPHTEAASSTALANAVFGGPSLDYSFSSKSGATDPAWVGGRRTGTFSPDGHIDAADLPADYAATGSFTVSAWVHLPAPDASGFVAGERTGVLTVANASDDYWLCCYLYNDSLNAWGAGVAFYNGASNTYTDGPLAPALVDEEWPAGDIAGTDRYHLVTWAVTSGATYTLDVYVNGELVGTTSGITAPTTPSGSASLYDGDIKSDVGGSFIDTLGLTGSSEKSVAGIGFWDRALSATEAASLAESAIDGFASELSSVRVNRLLVDFGWPIGQWNLQSGQVTLAEVDANDATYLAALQRVELTEFGDLFIGPDGLIRFFDRDYRTDDNNTTKETFDTADTEAAFRAIGVDYSDELVVNLARLTGTNGVAVARDEASIRAGYGVREFARTVDAEVSQAQAAAIVTRFAQPQPRPRTFVVKPTRDPARLFPSVLDLGITDKVAITVPTVGTDPTITARISRVTHVFDTEDWTTTYGLEVEP